jgi:integrase
MEGTAMAVQVVAQEQHRRTRRRGQRGSIFKRGDAWTVVYRTREGKQKWEGGFRTRELAQTRLNEVLDTIRTNRYVEPKETLFKAFCDDWMESAKAILKPRTWCSYQSALNNWITPAFGEQQLSDIRKADVVNFLYGLLKDREISRKFVRNVHIFLHRLFEAAIERELLAANPAHKIKLPEASPVFGATGAVERVVPTPAEVAMTFKKLTPIYQALLATSAVTGARRGELLGLYWEDIDWNRSVIHIWRTLQRVTKKFLDAESFRGVERIGQTGLAIVPPKSKKALRFIEMPSKLAVILKTLRNRQKGSSVSFVFQTEIGGPIDPDALYHVLSIAQDAAQVRHFGLHGLRHLYCSLLQENGASLKFAQERLGHADASTTANIYTHVVSDQGREFAERVEAAFPFAVTHLINASSG